MKDNRKNHQQDRYKFIEIDVEDPILRTFMLCAQTCRAMAKYDDAYLNGKAGISEVELIVLMAFHKDPTAVITPSEIAHWTITERHNVTTLIQRMKRDGLINIERNERDKRFLNITLTDKGREVLSQAIPVANECVKQVMSSISIDEAVLFEKQVRIIRHNTLKGLEDIALLSQPKPD